MRARSGAREKENRKLAEASLPGATCSRPASHTAACDRCVCVAGEGVRHGKGDIYVRQTLGEARRGVQVPGGRSRREEGGCAAAARHKQDQLFLVNRNTAARKKHDVPIEKMLLVKCA